MKPCVSALLLGAFLAAGALPAQAQNLSQQQPSQQQPTPQPSPEISPQPIVPLSAGDVAAASQQFVNFLAMGDYAAAQSMYDLTINATVTPASIQTNWEDIVAAAGTFGSVTSTRTVSLENPAGGTMAIVNVRFQNGSRDLYIVFNTTYKVVSFDVVEAQ